MIIELLGKSVDYVTRIALERPASAKIVAPRECGLVRTYVRSSVTRGEFRRYWYVRPWLLGSF